MRNSCIKFVALYFMVGCGASQSIAQQTCLDLFTSNSEAAHVSFTEIKKLFSDGFLKSIDYRPIIHNTVLEIAKRRVSVGQINAYLEVLDSYINKNGQRQNSFSEDVVGTYLSETALLFILLKADLNVWKAALLSEQASEPGPASISGTMGFLVRLLPWEKQNELLKFLGGTYLNGGTEITIKPIHTILAGDTMYAEYKRKGFSDRRFYRHYLERLDEYAFASKIFGGYGSDLIIDAAKTVQRLLIDGKLDPQIKALDFVGDIPNGFGTASSKLEIYYPYDHNYNSNVDYQKFFAARVEGRLTDLNQIKYRRFPEVDWTPPSQYRTAWGWRSPTYTEKPQAQFAGPFSFHITAENIELRFYQNFAPRAPGSKSSRPEYIVLKVN